MIRSRIGRWATRLAVTSVVALQVFAGTAGAANTRLVYLGSGPVGAATNGQFVLSDVTVGGVTAANVVLKNTDNQTLTHVVVTFATPTGGLEFSGFIAPSAGTCAPTATSPLVCAFGNLAKGQTRTWTVLYTATAAVASEVRAEVTFNESGNPNGSNSHIEPATASLTPSDGGCDLVATYLPPGQAAKVVGTSCALSAANPQITTITVPGSLVSAIKVGEQTSSLCAGTLTCFGQDSIADIAVDGTYTVTWTIVWQVPTNFNANRFGVLHFPDGATTPDLTLTARKNTCKTAAATGCIVSVTLDGTTLTAVVRTNGNGKMRGFG